MKDACFSEQSPRYIHALFPSQRPGYPENQAVWGSCQKQKTRRSLPKELRVKKSVFVLSPPPSFHPKNSQKQYMETCGTVYASFLGGLEKENKEEKGWVGDKCARHTSKKQGCGRGGVITKTAIKESLQSKIWGCFMPYNALHRKEKTKNKPLR